MARGKQVSESVTLYPEDGTITIRRHPDKGPLSFRVKDVISITHDKNGCRIEFQRSSTVVDQSPQDVREWVDEVAEFQRA